MLIVAPWTTFWERNLFVSGWEGARNVLLSPWLRGAISGLGTVAFGAGLLDLAGAFIHRAPAKPPSPVSR